MPALAELLPDEVEFEVPLVPAARTPPCTAVGTVVFFVALAAKMYSSIVLLPVVLHSVSCVREYTK